MNIIEAVKLLKTGKKIKRKGERYREHHYETYDIKKGWLIFFFRRRYFSRRLGGGRR